MEWGFPDTLRRGAVPGGVQAAGTADAGPAGHRQPGGPHEGVSCSNATLRRTRCISAFPTGSIGRRPGRWSLPRARAATRKLAKQFEHRDGPKSLLGLRGRAARPAGGHVAGYRAKSLRQAAGGSGAGRSSRGPLGRAPLSNPGLDRRGARGWRSNWKPAARTRSAFKRPPADIRVLGDFQYGSTVPFGPQHADERLRAIALHARTLAFRHPVSKQSVSVTAPLPEFWPPFGE